MIDFFMKDKCDVYTKTIVTEGAGDVVSWSKDRSIKAYIEPVNGERLFGTELGNNENISFIIYTKNIINDGERLAVNNSNFENNWYEIRGREFYRMPFFNYYKGYLVKTDENL